MKRIPLFFLIPFFIIAGSLIAYYNAFGTKYKVGIVLPLEHPSMNAIVSGFKQTLEQEWGDQIAIDVLNAQNDLNLERAMIEKVKAQHMDLIVPIGLQATQMTLSMTDSMPVLSLASRFDEADRANMKNCHMTALQDEIDPLAILEFLKAAFPTLKAWTIVHSPAEKEFENVAILKQNGPAYGLEIRAHMVNLLSELYTMAAALPPETQGILVLKDHLIVSGMRVLSQIATRQQIPLVATDEGSMHAGAQIAFGVHEQAIGTYGGELAIRILKGRDPCQIPIERLQKLTVFMNENQLKEAHQSEETIAQIHRAAAQKDYGVERYQ